MTERRDPRAFGRRIADRRKTHDESELKHRWIAAGALSLAAIGCAIWGAATSEPFAFVATLILYAVLTATIPEKA